MKNLEEKLNIVSKNVKETNTILEALLKQQKEWINQYK